MTDLDLAINGAELIDAAGRRAANLGVRDGRIVALSQDDLRAERVIDASGKWVLPGVIDAHVHFAFKQGQTEDAVVTEDDYRTGPITAAVGGVTTFIDFAITPRSRSPKEFMLERIEMASAGSCIDFGFHAGVTNPDPSVLEEFPEIVELGIPSFKFFVTYRKWGFAVDLGFLMAAMERLRDLNGIACLHAENDEVIEFLRAKYADQPAMEYHGRSRPDFTEEIAVYEALTLARETGCRLYVVHVSSRKALDLIRAARARGLRVRAETCPHYLAFTEEVYRSPKARLYTMTPPLRSEADRRALWAGVADGALSVVSSDHNLLGRTLKERAASWLEVPQGLGGTEMLLTYVHSEGVVKGLIGAERMAALLSAQPAALFGVANKGALQIGYDADLVVFDPELRRTVRHEDLATAAGFSIFEGMELTGWPTHTIARGEVIVEGREFVGALGRGRFVRRSMEEGGEW